MPITRSFKNVVYNYTDVQRKVREATSNDPWGPSSTIMTEIADATYNMAAFQEIMDIVWKRLNDHGKNWRHVYKALTLLEYIIKTGSDRVTQNCRENVYAIQTLKDFQFVDKDNKDQGLNVREKAKHLVALLKDDERLKEEREKALKAKERFIRASGQTGKPVMQGYPMNPTSQQITFHPTPPAVGVPVNVAHPSPGPVPVVVGPNPNVVPSNTSSNSGIATVDSVISEAPSTAAEEEMQLNLALAMSRQTAQDQEKQQFREDQQLKRAIDESILVSQQKQQIPSDTPSSSDPWSTAEGPISAGKGQLPTINMQSNTADPWGSTASSNPSVSNTLTQPPVGIQTVAGDPWSVQPTNSQNPINTTDPWSAHSAQAPMPSVDPWSTQQAKPSIETAAITSDPWSSNGALTSNIPIQPVGNQPTDPFPVSATTAPPTSSDPWGLATDPPTQPGKAVGAGSLSSNESKMAMNDAWASSNATSAISNDPWQSQQPIRKDDLDDFASLRLTNTLSDTTDSNSGNNSSILIPMNASQSTNGDPSSAKLKNAKSFLGENSSLVNLDTLVVNPPVADGLSTNPFQNSSNQRPQNPFCQPQQRPSMNQLRNSSGTGMVPGPGAASSGSGMPFGQPMQPFPAQNYSNPF